MGIIREPAVAGHFYPEDREELASIVDRFLADAPDCHIRPKAIIAPHAGYQYSGPVAGRAFDAVKAVASRIQRVVLLGPSHQIAFSGLAVSGADAFQTPLGAVPLDRAAIEDLLVMDQVVELNEAHVMEHSLEVELPFLQESLGAFQLIPLVVGDATYKEVSEVLDVLWGGDETLIVVSSDLSHYLGYQRARELDEATRQAIEALRPEDLTTAQACGRVCIGGLLLSARKRGMHVTTLGMRNSGDTAGPTDRVVGYGAYAVY